MYACTSTVITFKYQLNKEHSTRKQTHHWNKAAKDRIIASPLPSSLSAVREDHMPGGRNNAEAYKPLDVSSTPLHLNLISNLNVAPFTVPGNAAAKTAEAGGGR